MLIENGEAKIDNQLKMFSSFYSQRQNQILEGISKSPGSLVRRRGSDNREGPFVALQPTPMVLSSTTPRKSTLMMKSQDPATWAKFTLS